MKQLDSENFLANHWTLMYSLDNRYGKSLTAGPGQLSSLFASLCGEVIRYQFGQLLSELA